MGGEEVPQGEQESVEVFGGHLEAIVAHPVRGFYGKPQSGDMLKEAQFHQRPEHVEIIDVHEHVGASEAVDVYDESMPEQWPQVDDANDADQAVNNVCNMLLSYPHRKWDKWPAYISVPPAEVLRVFVRWRVLAGKSAGRDFFDRFQ